MVESDIFPWLGDEVTDAVNAGWDNGVRNREGLLLLALSLVYPETPAGVPLTWPAVPGDSVAIQALEARASYRVNLVVADREDAGAAAAWEEAGGR